MFTPETRDARVGCLTWKGDCSHDAKLETGKKERLNLKRTRYSVKYIFLLKFSFQLKHQPTHHHHHHYLTTTETEDSLASAEIRLLFTLVMACTTISFLWKWCSWKLVSILPNSCLRSMQTWVFDGETWCSCQLGCMNVEIGFGS